MGQIVNFAKKEMIREFFVTPNGVSVDLEVALFNNGSELSGDNYSRVTVASTTLFNTTEQISGSTVSFVSANAVNFAAFDNPKTYDQVKIYKAAAPTVSLAEGDVFTERTADEVRIDAGQLSISLT